MPIKFTAGTNRPGFMPETPADQFNTLEEAKDFLISELESDIEQAVMVVEHGQFTDERDEAHAGINAMESAIREIRTWSVVPASVTAYGRAYWLASA